MHLAQLNIARVKAPFESPEMQEFIKNLEPVNSIADTSEGFCWRLAQDPESIDTLDDTATFVNMSVWESVEALKNFIFKTDHLKFLQRKKEWFVKYPGKNQVLWWVPVGHIPTIEEGEERLKYLEKNGESTYAFTFRSKYAAPKPAALGGGK